ncbi:NAD(P)/FAD-dependent oxidoreductase [Aeromicrobium sp. YIM 150415]|uniref:flavin-containing monooxygenase n=1 Tax=Aeromicrobium sp. YIM 150415 TaxID=2803912 RepID=UPI001964206D|nr:NAD(P)/FAD-dependent oxidoreductase [Aeromicrobium sp. YIM 150415]MBM9464040.1 NAD(P)/FAD-dependent oxidoreductase [Aeromicrobium sp. YIM 150415]
MTEVATQSDTARTPEVREYDVVIIGAGLTGMHQLLTVRELGLSVRVIEAGSGVGGTWYWNRYPGARLDSESYSYQYAFDKELLDEWQWKEMFASQPELEAYYNRVADKHEIRKDVDFDTRIASMVFDESTDTWDLVSTEGTRYRAKVVVAATGILSDPNFPNIPGLENFKGEWHHTAMWPKEKVDFTGKRVAVIGTGATGVQVIPEVAKTAGHLTVFQRTANWAVPLRNRPLSDEDMSEIRDGYPEMFEKLRNSFSGFLHSWDPVKSTDVSVDERDARYEEAWNSPGFTKWIGLYNDLAYDAEANKIYCDFLASKIRERINDPAIADKVIPDDHYFGTKRVPCETNYYETYNRDNVDLILLKENPIEEFTEKGVRTADGEMEFDIIVLATGFDAFTGALNQIDIEGLNGATLREKWKDGPKTYLGIQVAGFPNFFIMGGPHGKGGHGNGPRCAEPVIEWMATVINDIFTHPWGRIEADPEAERLWTQDVVDAAAGTLQATAKSIFFGDNIEGKPRVYVAYLGSLPEFVQRLNAVRDEGYRGFILS